MNKEQARKKLGISRTSIDNLCDNNIINFTINDNNKIDISQQQLDELEELIIKAIDLKLKGMDSLSISSDVGISNRIILNYCKKFNIDVSDSAVIDYQVNYIIDHYTSDEIKKIYVDTLLNIESKCLENTIKRKEIQMYNCYFGNYRLVLSLILGEYEYKLLVSELQNKKRGYDTYINKEDFEEYIINNKEKTMSELVDDLKMNSVSQLSHRLIRTGLSGMVENKYISYYEKKVEDLLKKLNLNYKKNDRTILKPYELDFVLVDYNVAIEVNDFISHSSSYAYNKEKTKPKKYHLDKTLKCEEKGYRLIHIWQHDILNERRFKIIENIIKHACGLTDNKVYARNTKVVIKDAIDLKQFFLENNIQGYRNADKVYALVDKKDESNILMAYSVGRAHFGKGKYDVEIARGACKLGYSVIGGASKLWKAIIDTYRVKGNPVNSIVYYIDLNYYNGQSLKFLKGVECVSTQYGIHNYFVEDRILKNRQPSKHHEIKKLIEDGKVWVINDAGTRTNVWCQECNARKSDEY